MANKRQRRMPYGAQEVEGRDFDARMQARQYGDRRDIKWQTSDSDGCLTVHKKSKDRQYGDRRDIKWQTSDSDGCLTVHKKSKDATSMLG